MTNDITARLEELGITLPQLSAPLANYVPNLISDGNLYISGQLPMADGAVTYAGRLGAELDVEAGQAAARLCAVNILAQASAALDGDLDRIKRLVRLGGFVAATAEFSDHPKVINGASDLMVEVFGKAGRHTRIAAGCASLPLGAAVEIDALFEVG
ncbi:MAG: RidA family protein [Alphaproteobacteria bacterium]|nr:RidA family protein [Alphaproteobacteria bacterium]